MRKNTALAIVRFKRAEKIDRELDELERQRVGVLTLHDPLYPLLLAKIHDPPPYLYYKGSPSVQDEPLSGLGGVSAGDRLWDQDDRTIGLELI